MHTEAEDQAAISPMHQTQCTMHNAQCTMHCKRHQCAMHNAHCPMHNAHASNASTRHRCAMRNSHTAQCITHLPATHCTMHQCLNAMHSCKAPLHQCTLHPCQLVPHVITLFWSSLHLRKAKSLARQETTRVCPESPRQQNLPRSPRKLHCDKPCQPLQPLGRPENAQQESGESVP